MTCTSPAYNATSDIPVSVFVRITTNADFDVQACVANEVAIGVSDYAPQDAVLPGGSVGPAAVAGTAVRVFGLGETCEVLAGGTIQAGQYVKPDANGKAVACSTNDKYSAIARSGATAANQLVKVILEHGTTP